MKNHSPSAEVNIHLRARVQDRQLIDSAAELLGFNRSQFMLASALKEARKIIAEQTSLAVDNQTFCQIMDSLDAPATPEQQQGMERLRAVALPWASDE